MSRYFALSRTVHVLLDIAAPAFCALLWLGSFPPWHITVLALATAFAAYTSVYALNDIVGLKYDRQKFSGAQVNQGYAVDGSARRHPLAQNALPLRGALIWTSLWFGLALAGSYWLNPWIVVVLLGGVLLEVFYCRLLKVTHLRALLSGLVKTSGPIAAVLVVDANPAPFRLLLMILWLFLWELGGQNIPSDWNDTVEDRRVDAQTIPIRFGLKSSGRIILAALAVCVFVSALLPWISPAPLGALYVLGTVLLGGLLLLRPAFQLQRMQQGRLAARLFDSASYYPLGNLALLSAFLAAQGLPGG